MTESSSVDSPPEYQQNDIHLVAQASSRIAAVSLYPGRAEVTRVFKLSLKPGSNRIKISGLPTFLERSSLRVEGRGSAVIHDVTVASAIREPVLHTSEVLSNLYLKTKRAEQEVARCEAAASSLEQFFHALTPGQVEVTKLHTYMETFEDEARKIDERLLLVRQELDGLRVQIAIEESRLRSLSCSVPELSINVSVVVFADDEGEAEISLIYGVAEANWSAQYDLRVNLESKEKAVKLIYKASICQNTGEACFFEVLYRYHTDYGIYVELG
ncbi:hypothetical protein ONZ45_g18128 [Pleurotus djamor]|nr:hypothetical protein ONZ45_g18128 [Pleurotus djamor]